MPKPAKIVLSVVTLYSALWAITLFCGPRLLRYQILEAAKAEWLDADSRQRERNRRDPRLEQYYSMAFKSGPKVEVRLRSCLWPLYFEAETSRSIGGLNGSGAIGTYVFTPWKVYEIYSVSTWIS
jgi:hypothetical protein